MEKIRTFIAIEIPLAIRTEIAKFQEQLKQEQAPISWVKPNNIHITIKFLGDVDENKIDDIALAIQTATTEIKPFSIEIGGAGAFPNYKKPRVIWIGAKSEHDLLKELAKQIDIQVHKLGFEKETRDFKAHLTLGRVKSLNDIDGVISELKQRQDFSGGSFIASEIILMKSELHPAGSIYTPMRKIPLIS